MTTNTKRTPNKQPQLIGDIINQILCGNSPFARAMRAHNNIVGDLIESVTVKAWELAGNEETNSLIFNELGSKKNEIHCKDIVTVSILAAMEKYGENINKYEPHGRVAHQANEKLDVLYKENETKN